MVKFTEIFSKPKQYDPVREHITESYGVREVFLNPKYIISARENTSLYEKSQREEMVEGLNKNLFFTEISLDTPGNSARLLNIVGAPEFVLEKIREVGG